MNVTLPTKIGRPSARDSLHLDAVARVIDAMRANLYDPLSLDDMADIACFSPFHFNRLFKEVTGIPPSQFLYALRLDHAKRLLVTSDLNVTDICFEVGYNSLGSFTNRFTDLVGLSPNAFRKFAKEFDGFTLSSIRNMVTEPTRSDTGSSGPAGRLNIPTNFDGLIFIGMFRRAIPERQPMACLLLTKEREFRFSGKAAGAGYLFSVALPWSATSRDLLTLDNAHRGRSEKLSNKKSKESKDITLRPSDHLHPPILAALPVLVTRKLAGIEAEMPPECEAAMGGG